MRIRSIFISRVSTFLVATFLYGTFLSSPTPAETFTTLRGALDEVADRYQIQMGLEYATNDKDLQPINLDLTARSIEVVLTQLTNQKTVTSGHSQTTYTMSTRTQIPTVFLTSRFASLRRRTFLLKTQRIWLVKFQK
jgi:hypothetical protein